MKGVSQWWLEDTVDRPRNTKITVSAESDSTWQGRDNFTPTLYIDAYFDEIIDGVCGFLGNIFSYVLFHSCAAEYNSEDHASSHKIILKSTKKRLTP